MSGKKRHTQQIERTPRTLRPRIKRLTRKTICFSTSIALPAIVIGLLWFSGDPLCRVLS
jgi:insertion element IS1 protein InsB